MLLGEDRGMRGDVRALPVNGVIFITTTLYWHVERRGGFGRFAEAESTTGATGGSSLLLVTGVLSRSGGELYAAHTVGCRLRLSFDDGVRTVVLLVVLCSTKGLLPVRYGLTVGVCAGEVPRAFLNSFLILPPKHGHSR